MNVSHEIRTPLTLIKWAIDRLAAENSFTENREFNRLKRNSERLIRMVNEVLDLKKLEHPKVEITKRYFNLKQFLEATIDAFRLRDDNITIRFAAPDSPVWINTSRELLETIMYNLLSNAVKFNTQKSIVEVSLVAENQHCTIKVKDYGIGIPAEKRNLIFERFYKSAENNKTGAGIGLAIVKEFSELLPGNISVDSEFGTGSTFTLKLPLGDAAGSEIKHRAPLESIDNKNAPTLLVVDDQAEIRSFVKEIFMNDWVCLEAANGEAAWQIILKSHPDCILSDVMMPKMNGFDLCQKVRSDIRTSHLPFILLTAKIDAESEMKALKCKASDFVTKPFNEKIVKLKVEKIIEQQKQLWSYFRRQTTLDLANIDLSEMDKAFIEKLEATIVVNIDNIAFSVDDLANATALSTSGLYRKLKTLSGLSPVEFIRNFRLKKAAKLLVETKLPVTEISDKTGFGTQKYFSRCFKEQYNISPLQFRRENRQNTPTSSVL